MAKSNDLLYVTFKEAGKCNTSQHCPQKAESCKNLDYNVNNYHKYQNWRITFFNLLFWNNYECIRSCKNCTETYFIPFTHSPRWLLLIMLTYKKAINLLTILKYQNIKTRKLALVQCVCMVQYHFITCADSLTKYRTIPSPQRSSHSSFIVTPIYPPPTPSNPWQPQSVLYLYIFFYSRMLCNRIIQYVTTWDWLFLFCLCQLSMDCGPSMLPTAFYLKKKKFL